MPRFAVFAAPCRLAGVAAGLVAGWIAPAIFPAEPPLARNFDGPALSWELIDRDRGEYILSQDLAAAGHHDHGSAERIVVAAPAGESAQILCPAAEVAVLDELEVRLWIKANRPDVQLAARVVLPRSVDPAQRTTAQIIVRGAKYTRPGHWQQLTLNNIPGLLADQIRVLRSTPSAKADPREAYVDAIMLLIPGDPQGVEVQTDDLEIDGVPRAGASEVQQAGYTGHVGASNAPTDPHNNSVPANLRRLTKLAAPTPGEQKTTVRLRGDVLLLDDKPFVPRIVQGQGEPLQFLAERGFNTVLLNAPPTTEQSVDARKHGLWFICRPPHPETLTGQGLGQPNDRVLAWLLEDDAIDRNISYARRWSELVRERDAAQARPIIIAPNRNWNAASKVADIILARRFGLALTTDSNYDHWLQGCFENTRPGTPIWASLPTQVDAAVARQIACLGGVAAIAPSFDARQLDALAQTAGRRGVRGFAFQSASPLNERGAATQLRANELELINRRLQRLEPWLAAGSTVGQLNSVDATWNAVVMRVDSARLLVPSVATLSEKPPASETAFVVPGVAASCQVYDFSPVALKPLGLQRVAGGARFMLRPSADSLVLITEDLRVVQSMRQLVARDGARTARAECQRAALRSAANDSIARRSAQLGVNTDAMLQTLASVNVQLQQANAAFSTNRFESSHQLASAANRTLDRVETELRQSIRSPARFVSNPLACSDATLVELAAFQRGFSGLRASDNLLYGGDFEDIGQLTQFGWHHFRDANANVAAQAELSATDPRHGSYCLALRSTTDPTTPAPAPSDVALWVETPPIPVTAGQLIEIAGWVQIEKSPAQGADSLQIIDSLGGPELALAVAETNGWERFTLIRAVPESTELRLTFALRDAANARLDAVMIRTLQPASPGTQTPLLRPAGTNAPATPAALAPRFVAPTTR